MVSWNDLSGNGHDLFVAPLGVSPVYAASLINGYPGVDFDSVNRGLKTASFTLGTEVTVFTVVQWRSANDWGAIAHHGDRDFDWSLEKVGALPSTHFQSANDNDSAHSIELQPGANYLLVGRIQNSGVNYNRSYATYPDCVVLAGVPGTPGIPCTVTAIDASAMVGAGSPQELYVGTSDILEDSRAFIGELIYYSRALTDPEQDTVITYLRARWGI